MKIQILIAYSLLYCCQINAQIITTIGGGVTGHGGYWGDGGPATAAEMSIFAGIAVDQYDNIFIADGNNKRVRMIDNSTGIIKTVAGTGVAGFFGDGGPATNAKIEKSIWLANDLNGNLYITDGPNHRIRKVNSAGIITTVAGNGVPGYFGDGGAATAAELNSPQGICVDNFGNLYIADGSNNVIRKVDGSGTISTYAGIGTIGYSGDGGPATAAEMSSIWGIETDKKGNLYITDGYSKRIRKIEALSGIIYSVAGTGTSTYTADEVMATASNIDPWDVYIDDTGSIFIADYANNRIREVDTFGYIHTVAGIGTSGFSGDGGPATASQLYGPEGVTLNSCGQLLIADSQNKRARKVALPVVFTHPTISITGITSYSAGATVTVNATVANAGSSYLIHWLNKGIEFTTTTVPIVTYTKTVGTDTITARVVSTSAYGCYDSTTSNKHIVTTITVGTTALLPAGLAVYPNPVGNMLHIETSTALHYQLQNIVGSVMKDGQLNKGLNDISIGELPQGIYLLECMGIGDGARTVMRIMKE